MFKAKRTWQNMTDARKNDSMIKTNILFGSDPAVVPFQAAFGSNE